VGFEGKNMNYTIYPLYNGAFTVGFGSQEVFSNIENIPSFCFLVIGDDHTPVLVDEFIRSFLEKYTVLAFLFHQGQNYG
jgi:hypothetical protein